MDGQPRNTLPKKERLCGKTGISLLLAKGRYGNVPGLKYCYLSDNGQRINRIMVSVPKKLFKRAVKRNLLKRRLRESFRKQKHLLTSETGVDLLITYSAKEVMSYTEIYDAVSRIIAGLNKAAAVKKDNDEKKDV